VFGQEPECVREMQIDMTYNLLLNPVKHSQRSTSTTLFAISHHKYLFSTLTPRVHMHNAQSAAPVLL